SDKTVLNATDASTLPEPNANNNWLGGKAELILDRYRMEGLNFPVGTRAKIYFESFNNVDNPNRSTHILGFDFRWYKKIHSRILWANRLSGSASFGPSLVNYFVGG